MLSGKTALWKQVTHRARGPYGLHFGKGDAEPLSLQKECRPSLCPVMRRACFLVEAGG